MDAPERAAIVQRIDQIKVELTFPKLTVSQANALQLELRLREHQLASDDTGQVTEVAT